MNRFIKLLQMLIGPPCGKHIILSIVFFAFFLWGNAHVQLPGLWFVIVGVILVVSIRNTVLLLLLSINITEETHFICLVHIDCSRTFIINVYVYI